MIGSPGWTLTDFNTCFLYPTAENMSVYSPSGIFLITKCPSLSDAAPNTVPLTVILTFHNASSVDLSVIIPSIEFSASAIKGFKHTQKMNNARSVALRTSLVLASIL